MGCATQRPRNLHAHSISLRKQHPLVCGSALWQDQKLLEGRSYILIIIDLTHGCTKCEQISHFWMSFFLAMDTGDCCSLRQRCPQDQVLNCTMKRSTQSSHSVLHGIALPLHLFMLINAWAYLWHLLWPCAQLESRLSTWSVKRRKARDLWLRRY